MSALDFAMVTEAQFRRLPATSQNGIFWDALASDTMPDVVARNRNAARRWAAVEAAKDAYWLSRMVAGTAKRARTGRHDPDPPATRPTTRHSGQITAAECNAWLRSPPRLDTEATQW